MELVVRTVTRPELDKAVEVEEKAMRVPVICVMYRNCSCPMR